MAFSVKLQQTTQTAIIGILGKVGIPRNNIYFADGIYYYTTLAQIKDILKYDTVNDKKYVAEIYDCDDFSLTIRASFREYYGLNIVGEARQTELRNAQTDKHIGWHRCNIFLAEDDGMLKPFLLEPQKDTIIEIKDINKLVIGNWRYVLNSVDL